MDLRAREVEVGLLQVGLSRENQRVQTFELGFQAGHLLTLRLQIGLGLATCERATRLSAARVVTRSSEM